MSDTDRRWEDQESLTAGGAVRGKQLQCLDSNRYLVPKVTARKAVQKEMAQACIPGHQLRLTGNPFAVSILPWYVQKTPERAFLPVHKGELQVCKIDAVAGEQEARSFRTCCKVEQGFQPCPPRSISLQNAETFLNKLIPRIF